jgi:hypothetical protein
MKNQSNASVQALAGQEFRLHVVRIVRVNHLLLGSFFAALRAMASLPERDVRVRDALADHIQKITIIDIK